MLLLWYSGVCDNNGYKPTRRCECSPRQTLAKCWIDADRRAAAGQRRNGGALAQSKPYERLRLAYRAGDAIQQRHG